MAKKSSIGRRKKSTTGRRKVARKPAARKAIGATAKLFGKVYTRKSCSKTKAAAQASANSSKRAGKSAFVKKNPAGGYCTFTRNKKKS
ncbi:MAG: hypothetical protein IPI45_04490 [Saprospiraceae bacterium]|nr:hypothetical protein [Saprospiraceae bacterium]MBK7737021.1 hypothetical protein [Saprospiraceae bacterium]MBK7914384.1 hypothetical protein [Saprospiraceae bacterium]